MKVIKKDSKYYAGGKMKKLKKYYMGGKAKSVKKYEKGGAMTNTEDTYTSRIESLKNKIKAEEDSEKREIMLGELQELRRLAKEERANVQSDTFKEKRARMAESKGDKGRAIRIRSSKNTQGVGEVGK